MRQNFLFMPGASDSLDDAFTSGQGVKVLIYKSREVLKNRRDWKVKVCIARKLKDLRRFMRIRQCKLLVRTNLSTP